MRVKHLINRKIVAPNSIIAVWDTREIDNNVCHYCLWRGMVWALKDERPDLYNSKFVTIFGTIPQSITQADTVNIEVKSCS